MAIIVGFIGRLVFRRD